MEDDGARKVVLKLVNELNNWDETDSTPASLIDEGVLKNGTGA